MENYKKRWEHFFHKNEFGSEDDGSQEGPRSHEWHASIDPNAECGRILSKYLENVDRSEAMDLGVGTSDSPRVLLDAFKFSSLHLVDCCESVIDKASKEYDGNNRVKCHVGDCRDLQQSVNGDSFSRGSTFNLALDKGTLDALDTDDERDAMLTSVFRCLDFESGGIFASVSFLSSARIHFLRSAVASRNDTNADNGSDNDISDICNDNHKETKEYCVDFHVLHGDPASGADARLFAVIYRNQCTQKVEISKTTEDVLRRLDTSGSLVTEIDAEAEEDAGHAAAVIFG